MKPRSQALVAVAVCLLSAGCGESAPRPHANVQTTPTAAPTTASTTGGARPSRAPSAGATRAAASPAASPAPTARASFVAPAAAASFTAPGRYTYDSHGTVTAGTPRKVDGTAELDVDKPSGARQHSSLGGDEGGTEQDVLHRSTGTYLLRLALSTAGQNKEFRPAQPVLGYPRPATVGRSWSWSMTSTDGKTHASYAANVVRRETIAIGGTSVVTWVIDSTLKLTGDLTFTDHESTWYDDLRLLQVKTRSQGSGSFSGVPFTTDTTSTLRSLKPS